MFARVLADHLTSYLPSTPASFLLRSCDRLINNRPNWQAGEEMFNAYNLDFAPCPWYDELQTSRSNVPLSALDDHINSLYDKRAV